MTRLAFLYPAAAASGAVWALCFTAEPRLWLPWIALSPLLFLLRQRHYPALALVHGISAWLVSIPWISQTVATYGGLASWLGAGSLLLLAVYLGSYHLVFALLSKRLLEGPAWHVAFLLPAIWVALEWLRTFLISGFPWNLAGYAWIATPGALEISAWIGAYGVSYLVLFSNTALFLAIDRRRPEAALIAFLAPLLLLAVAARMSLPSDPPRAPLRVRVLQPNTPILTNPNSPEVQHAYRKMLRLSKEACDRRGTLLIWPESATWNYALERDPEFRNDLRELTESGCGVLLNSPRWTDSEVFNSAFLIEDEKPTQFYDKRHLVPFGEYVPLAGLLPFVGSLARNAGSFSAGHEATVLDWRGEGIGVSVCFEITFATEVADLVRGGATVLATITNDAWYGDTAAPHQHFRAARFRAAENGRPLVRAALTGISAIVAKDGSVLDSLGVGEEGILKADIEPMQRKTLFTRAPSAVPWTAVALSLFAIVWPARRGRHSLRGSFKDKRPRDR